MINNIKFLLEIYKENKKQIFKIKMGFFLIVNIILFLYIFIELNNLILFNHISIQSNLLDKGVSILNPFITYIGLNVVQCKLLIIFIFIIILNIIIIYFSMVLFVGFLIYLAKLWYKIQTNILINHENMKILDINFQYLLSEKEKKNILDTYILDNNVKIDIDFYNKIWDSISLLNDKKVIYNEIKCQIITHLTKLHIESQQTNTFNDYIISFTEFLNKIDTMGVIKGVIIVGVVVVGIYFVHSFFVSGVTASKNMSEAVLEANKKVTASNIDTLDNMRKQIIELNDNNNKMHEYSLDIEKNIGERLDNLDNQLLGFKEGLIKTVEWNDKITDSLNFLGKSVENSNNINDYTFSGIKNEIKNLIIEDSMTAQTIIELKKNMEQSQHQIGVLLRMTNYFHSYLIRSRTGNTPPIQVDENLKNDDID